MNTNRLLLIFTAIVICISALQAQTGTLKTVPVNMRENLPVKLSEITGEIKKISLELTDESLIGIINRIIFKDDQLIIFEGKTDKVMLFDLQGKYIRQIGSKGQGPDEYSQIIDIAYDDIERIVFIVSTSRKILCYNIEGLLIKECPIGFPEAIFFNDGYINLISTRFGEKVEKGYLNRTTLYRIDNRCNLQDSLIVKSVLLERLGGSTFPQKDFISQVNSQTFFYYPILTPEPIVRDTLYELKDGKLSPFLKLRFSDERSAASRNNKTKNLTNIWRSERFVFAHYQNRDGDFNFMHDLKTGQSANMKDGFVDDVHHTGTVKIRPLGDNLFYYLITPEFSDLEEEPNPDVYIGTFISTVQ